MNREQIAADKKPKWAPSSSWRNERFRILAQRVENRFAIPWQDQRARSVTMSLLNGRVFPHFLSFFCTGRGVFRLCGRTLAAMAAAACQGEPAAVAEPVSFAGPYCSMFCLPEIWLDWCGFFISSGAARFPSDCRFSRIMQESAPSLFPRVAEKNLLKKGFCYKHRSIYAL